MSDRIPRMPEDEAVSEKLFLSVATIYQLLIRKGLLTQAEYDAELQVLQALYREVKKGIQDEDLASAFQSLLGERGGPVQ